MASILTLARMKTALLSDTGAPAVTTPVASTYDSTPVADNGEERVGGYVQLAAEGTEAPAADLDNAVYIPIAAARANTGLLSGLEIKQYFPQVKIEEVVEKPAARRHFSPIKAGYTELADDKQNASLLGRIASVFKRK